MTLFKKGEWKKKRDKRKQVKELKRQRLETFKKRVANCKVEDLNKYIEGIENNGFSQKEIKKILIFLLLKRKDLDNKTLDRIKEIGKKNNITNVEYLVFEYIYLKDQKQL